MYPPSPKFSTMSADTWDRSSQHTHRTNTAPSITSKTSQPTQATKASAYSHQSSTTIVGEPTSPDPKTFERHWTAPSTSGGERVAFNTTRGVRTSAGAGSSQWQLAIETVIQYNFQNPDLLEEALESPGSGVVVVGKSNRVCVEGNKGLAIVGESVMKTVLKDQCYLFKVHENDMPKVINRIIGHQNLDKLGRRTKIESMIRPKAPLRASKKHNIFSLLKEDAQGEDPSRTIARAIKAIIGAVYYDGGLQAAQRVMSGMDLILKPPQR